ncbi:MAG: tetratricopeptide repeat protein [Acidobacteria bacterium]|nr:tetratricopeptide repeat protein [Acidobacteriota bacterium]
MTFYLRKDAKWYLPVVLAAVLVFANGIGGEFIYDDMRQIVRNPLIQDVGNTWKAITSDVWAFKGDGSIAGSSYWRPTFTLWQIVNFQLFGMSPAGWHVGNIALHALACFLAFALLRRWEFSAPAAFLITLIFAVHPVHVESVTWIAGVPDVLLTVFFLASLWFATSFYKTGSTNNLIISAILYALVLGSKEIGLLCLPIYYVLFLYLGRENEKKKPKADTRIFLIVHGVLAVAYFAGRWAVLGELGARPLDPVPIGNAILSVPSMAAFYLRQMFFPYWLGINYDLQPVETIGLTNFIIPAAVCIAVAAGIYVLVKRGMRERLALALFAFPLLLALNATAFPADQIVHDRYLYLPLLGALMLVVPLAFKLTEQKFILAAGIAICAALAFQTVRYNTAYANDIALWQWTAKVDSGSFTQGQLGSALAEAGRHEEAVAAYTKAIDAHPTPRNYLGRGRSLIRLKQHDRAINDLNVGLQFPDEKMDIYAAYQLYEALAVAYSETGRFKNGLDNLAKARIELPMYFAAISNNMAIILYQAGQKEAARIELENAREAAKNELLPESKSVLFRLGLLYMEQNRRDEARTALQEYLAQTNGLSEKSVVNNRAQAAKALERLR